MGIERAAGFPGALYWGSGVGGKPFSVGVPAWACCPGVRFGVLGVVRRRLEAQGERGEAASGRVVRRFDSGYELSCRIAVSAGSAGGRGR